MCWICSRQCQLIVLFLLGMFYCNSFLIIILRNQLLICHRDYLHLSYAGRPVAKLPCHVFGHVINNTQSPFLAYLDHSEIAKFREDSIPTPTCNLPVWRLRKITLARLRPVNVDQDPYLVGVLIALAHAQQYAHSANTAACRSSHTVHPYYVVSSLQSFADQEVGPSSCHKVW